MEILMSVVVGILFSAAVYLMLSKSLLRIIIGTGLLSHGAHLLILTMGGLKKELHRYSENMQKSMLIHFHKR